MDAGAQWGWPLTALGLPSLKLRDLGEDTAQDMLKGCAFHGLFRFKDKGSVPDLWHRTETQIPRGRRLGIHLRFGDVAWKADSSDRRPLLYDKDWGLGES